MIGARPFGEGLQRWLKSSPEFSLDRVRTPLQIVGIGAGSLLTQWEPYAAVHFLGKPVDLIMVADGTHNLSNPSARMASQGGTVDWMRFWLQDYEDPDSAKVGRARVVRSLTLRVSSTMKSESNYSYRSATIGSTRVARRAGK